MLSRAIARSFTRGFSTATPPAVLSSAGVSLLERAGAGEVEVPESVRSELRELEEVLKSEKKHLAYYANEYTLPHAA